MIILGILAAIVIPQFTNASNDARNNSVASTLQTMRGQIELFKIQHADTPPAATALATVLTGKTNAADTTQVVANWLVGRMYIVAIIEAPGSRAKTNTINT